MNRIFPHFHLIHNSNRQQFEIIVIFPPHQLRLKCRELNAKDEKKARNKLCECFLESNLVAAIYCNIFSIAFPFILSILTVFSGSDSDTSSLNSTYDTPFQVILSLTLKNKKFDVLITYSKTYTTCCTTLKFVNRKKIP
jgi:hypothetical protein